MWCTYLEDDGGMAGPNWTHHSKFVFQIHVCYYNIKLSVYTLYIYLYNMSFLAGNFIGKDVDRAPVSGVLGRNK